MKKPMSRDERLRLAAAKVAGALMVHNIKAGMRRAALVAGVKARAKARVAWHVTSAKIQNDMFLDKVAEAIKNGEFDK